MNPKSLTGAGSVATALILAGFLHAAEDAGSRQLEQATQQQAVTIQRQVEQLDARRQADFQQWRQVRRETLLLDAHNERQQAWNQRLREQIESLEQQLDSLDTTREALEPLLQDMAQRLEDFIRHDLPFRQDQRLHRVRELKSLLGRVDVSHAEKLRHLLNAYRSEVEQGRMLASSREFIRLSPEAETERLILLRVGRIGLYYLSEDERRAGYWSAEAGRWQNLGSRERQEVLRGLALAEERGLPEFLNLPLSVPVRDAVDGGAE
ncbi:DUF3450 domain-containing protein [Marinospirillum alkaliphilum]|uniref:DUF3450 domain-containing protein n=1 Tax=Marinospirillum alkaliphilum DSM 21637 TaxID=1122209 RepID=A0A1K1UYB8_9GAMM|nr:DUF3450 domain-containing protein [Marinospirillum alkaliphilum]SFX17815.1 Protein of unknown function [Marinospirillum alkaliphilum DSM 21637]